MTPSLRKPLLVRVARVNCKEREQLLIFTHKWVSVFL